jgi:hypothetical protein
MPASEELAGYQGFLMPLRESPLYKASFEADIQPPNLA